jgi:hypothetical protein
MLLNFHDDFLSVVTGDLKGLIDIWKFVFCGIETDVHHWTDDLGDLALYLSHEKCFFFGIQSPLLGSGETCVKSSK